MPLKIKVEGDPQNLGNNQVFTEFKGPVDFCFKYRLGGGKMAFTINRVDINKIEKIEGSKKIEDKRYIIDDIAFFTLLSGWDRHHI